jgi:hypothetical protein
VELWIAEISFIILIGFVFALILRFKIFGLIVLAEIYENTFEVLSKVVKLKILFVSLKNVLLSLMKKI